MRGKAAKPWYPPLSESSLHLSFRLGRDSQMVLVALVKGRDSTMGELQQLLVNFRNLVRSPLYSHPLNVCVSLEQIDPNYHSDILAQVAIWKHWWKKEVRQFYYSLKANKGSDEIGTLIYVLCMWETEMVLSRRMWRGKTSGRINAGRLFRSALKTPLWFERGRRRRWHTHGHAAHSQISGFFLKRNEKVICT